MHEQKGETLISELLSDPAKFDDEVCAIVRVFSRFSFRYPAPAIEEP